MKKSTLKKAKERHNKLYGIPHIYDFTKKILMEENNIELLNKLDAWIVNNVNENLFHCPDFQKYFNANKNKFNHDVYRTR